jgi:NADH:ubiquinone reductase (H+-translocating)
LAERPRVVVVGAGFGGLNVARSLRRADVDTLVLDETNYHLFQPLLYQVATAGLSPADIAYPVRGVLRRVPNAEFRLGTVTGADFGRRVVRTADGAEIGYDHLVLATGARSATFGVPGVEEHAFALKTLDDALRLRSHVLWQVERLAVRPSLLDDGVLTTVVVGGGPTGVEVAGAITELNRVLRRDFPRVPMDRARVVLIELTEDVLGPFHPVLRAHAQRQLRRRGVEVLLGQSVKEVRADGVLLGDGSTIESQTVVWAAGVRAASLADRLGLDQGPGGRILVDGQLAVPGQPGVWAIGDVAAAPAGDGTFLPQLAPVATQAGRYVAERIRLAADGAAAGPGPFRYRDKGIMATIGRQAAVAQLPLPAARFRGTIGWLMWLFLHLVMLIGFRNRASVLLNWAWNYVTWERGARLITDMPQERGRRSEPPTA